MPFTGIDWVADEHAVCVIDADGRVFERFTIDHTAEGLLVHRLFDAASDRPGQDDSDQGRARDEVCSGVKSDPVDARVIADYLRLRRYDPRVLHPFSDATRALRAVVRTRTDLVDARIAGANQLAAVLAAFWPGAGELVADSLSEISLAFLERYPTPAAASHLGEGRMAGFLRKHGYSGQRSPADLLERLRSAPAGLADGDECEARRDAPLAMIRLLRMLNHAIKDLDRSVVAYLD